MHERAEGLDWFDSALDSFHRAGNLGSLTPTLAYLSALFERTGQLEVAATTYGAITVPDRMIMGLDLTALIDRLRTALGDATFERGESTGRAMDVAEAVLYARRAIERTRRNPATVSTP